jgi:hypothetical protein
LVAIPKTPLYERLEKAERLTADVADNTKLGTNIVPKQMGYDEMVAGYRSLYWSLLENRNIAGRIRNKMRHFGPAANSPDTFGHEVRTFFKLLVRGLLPGGFSRMFHFVRSMPLYRPTLIPMAIGEWVVGLTMRSYVDSHFAEHDPPVEDMALSSAASSSPSLV